jgi:hypothetical protein
LQEEQRGEGRGTGDQGDGQRHDERLTLGQLAAPFARAGKDHPDGDEEQHDAAGHADRLLGEAQHAQEGVPHHDAGNQDDVRERDLPRQHPPPALGSDGLQHREEDRHVPERIHDEQQRDDCGREVHRRLPSGRHAT